MLRSRDSAFIHPRSSEITSREVYEGRRDLLRWMAGGAAGAALAGWAGREALAQTATPRPGKLAALPGQPSKVAGAQTMELGDYRMMPRATFSQPQVASFGLTEAEAVAEG
ncbi:MAG: hypothetical protein EOO29_29890, partial [Comamonadaceae bacterium]